jgi:hypothetical protein
MHKHRGNFTFSFVEDSLSAFPVISWAVTWLVILGYRDSEYEEVLSSTTGCL